MPRKPKNQFHDCTEEVYRDIESNLYRYTQEFIHEVANTPGQFKDWAQEVLDMHEITDDQYPYDLPSSNPLKVVK